MADTNTYNKYNQPKKVLSQSKFDALDKSDLPVGTEYDVVGLITEGDLDSDVITKINNNAKINAANTFTQQQNFDKGISVTGNVTLNGEIVKATTAELYVKDAIIHTRDQATTALGAGEYTGIQAIKYDGTNDGQLIFDNSGTARVGDVGDTQPLATRAEVADFTDQHIIIVSKDEANNSVKLIDSGKTINNVGPSFELDTSTNTLTITLNPNP